MTIYQTTAYRVRQLFSTLATASAANSILLEGEKWHEKDATTLRATGRSKTGDGVLVGTAPNQTINGTAFNDLPFDPGGSGSGTTDLSVISRTATGLTVASSTGEDAAIPLASADLAGLESAADKAKLNSIIVDSAKIVRIPVRNNSGVTIPKGAPCYENGTSGTTIAVALADASTEATSSQTLGLAEEAIPNNSFGNLIELGILDGLNTSALTEGQIVWLSETTGALTSTRPTQPAHGVICGYCVKQESGSSGILYVKVSNGLELYELHDVLIASPTTGQVLRRSSDGLWRNATLGATDVGADPVGTAAAAVAAHAAAADPHPGYATAAEAAAAAPVQSVAGRTGAVALAAGDVSGLGSLATQSGTFSGTSSGTNTGDQDLSSLLAKANNLSDLTSAATARGNLAAAGSGAIGSSGLTMATARILGRSTAGVGAPEEFSLLGLAFNGTNLATLADIVIPLSDETTALTASSTVAKVTIPYWPRATVITDPWIWAVAIAPTGAAMQFDIQVNGTSIYLPASGGIYPTIPIISTNSTASAGAFTTAFAAAPTVPVGASVAFFVRQIGSTVAGAGLKVIAQTRRAV